MNFCSSAVNSQRLLFSQIVWCEIFVLKLSGIQMILILRRIDKRQMSKKKALIVIEYYSNFPRFIY